MECRISFVSERVSGAINLEGILTLPERESPSCGLILLHPHPGGGGNMHAGLLSVISEEASSRGAAVLRFNFGGVGGSGGAFTEGSEEPLDVQNALVFLRLSTGVREERTVVGGWSFGAWAGLLTVVSGVRVNHIVAVAPPLNLLEWKGIESGLARSGVGVSFIVGERDQFCSLDELEEFASGLGTSTFSGTHVLARDDHFFFGREKEVSQIFLKVMEDRKLLQ